MRTFLSVRRLAAVAMHGMSGSHLRRTLIRAEFFAGVLGCCAFGLAVMVLSHGVAVVLGAYLVAIGLNYLPLAMTAQALHRPGALEAELRGVHVAAEHRSVGIRQLWILVPLAVAIASLLEREGR